MCLGNVRRQKIQLYLTGFHKKNYSNSFRGAQFFCGFPQEGKDPQKLPEYPLKKQPSGVYFDQPTGAFQALGGQNHLFCKHYLEHNWLHMKYKM